MILLLYLFVTAIFFSRAILRLEDDIFCHSSSRSRETKALMKRLIERDRVDLLLSLIWPVLLVRAARLLVINRKMISFTKNGKT